MKGLVNSICCWKERLAILKFTLRQKDAGLFDDLTEFNSFIRPRNAKLVCIRLAKPLQVTNYPYLNMRHSMTPDLEKI